MFAGRVGVRRFSNRGRIFEVGCRCFGALYSPVLSVCFEIELARKKSWPLDDKIPTRTDNQIYPSPLP
jgi:hypothetical protein